VLAVSFNSMVFLARNPNELGFFVEYVRSSGYQPIAQEYIGNHEQEYTVGVLSTLDGTLVGSLAMRRVLRGLSLKTRVPMLGGLGEWLALSTGLSQGRVEHASEIRRVCERIAIELGSRGPLNIQLRLVKGRVYPFEINPRFSGTCCLRALAGFNEPDILLSHHLLGEPIPQVRYDEGITIRALQNRFIPRDDGSR
jgi:carbamoyl-phosphate synthase large subunit